MILKVDPDELQDVTKVMKKDAERYYKEIENLEGSLETIKRNWVGEDADAFTTNFTNFLKKMRGIPATIETLSKICDKSNEGYTTRDKDFARELKEGAIENEQQ